ncbi:protein rolling stone [Biomphalaria glabrata]
MHCRTRDDALHGVPAVSTRAVPFTDILPPEVLPRRLGDRLGATEHHSLLPELQYVEGELWRESRARQATLIICDHRRSDH